MEKLNEFEVLRPRRSIHERTKSEYTDVEDGFAGGPATSDSIIVQTDEDLKSNIMSRGFNHRDYSLQEKTNPHATEAAQSGDDILRDWNDADNDDTSDSQYTAVKELVRTRIWYC